jgi:hypothetical protein
LKKNAPTQTALGPPALVSSKNFSLDITNMTKEQLAGRLIVYQQFMSKYIVEAQEQKMKAVQAAEEAITAKYEQKLKLYQAKTPTTPPEPSPATKLYQGRNSYVAAAAAAGKSRWGDMEVSKVQGKSGPVSVVHVNGARIPTVQGKSGPASISILSGSSLYYHRNQMVAAAGAAGKSRWGEAEVKKSTMEAANGPVLAPASSARAQSVPDSSAPPTAAKIVLTPEIEAADNAFGAGGPSSTERVNLGEQLFAAINDTSGNSGASAILYDRRNARVAAAAAIGKSRWGTLENDKATSLSSNLHITAASSAVAVFVPPEVEEADHGLRADGGVGGPSLAERVNLGANLLPS